MDMDKVFKALASPARRRLLDSLRVRSGQTLARARLADRAVIQDHDCIGAPDRRQPMGDDNRGAPAQQAIQRQPRPDS